jgi:hypothetical protein
MLQGLGEAGALHERVPRVLDIEGQTIRVHAPLGPHRFRFAGGKGGTAEATVEVAADGLKPLTVTHVEPGHGRPGTEVVIRGSGFAAGLISNAVLIGGVPATILKSEPGELRAVVPARAVSGKVAVSNESGIAIAPSEFTVPRAMTIGGTGQTVLRPGERTAFVGHVEGVANAEVRWSATSGSITADGIYTAPGVAGQPIQITAQSVADDRLTARKTLSLAPPAPVAKGALIGPAGGRVVSGDGLFSLDIPPSAFAKPTRLDVAAAFLKPERPPAGFPPEARLLAEIQMSGEGELRERLAFTMALPAQLAPGGKLLWARKGSGGSWSPEQVESSVSDDGLTARGNLTALGSYRMAEQLEDVYSLPYWAQVFGAPAQLTSILIPPARDADPDPNVTAIEEGMTVPVALRGSNFWPGHTRIVPENLRIASAQGIRPAPAGTESRLRIATVLVSATGDEAAVTLRCEPIEAFAAGETLLADLRLERLNTGGETVDSTVSPEPLRIRGLPELIVQAGETDLHTIEGKAIHAWTDQSGRYSTIRVEAGARLGIGRPVGSAVEVEEMTYDLSTIFRFESFFAGCCGSIARRAVYRCPMKTRSPSPTP